MPSGELSAAVSYLTRFARKVVALIRSTRADAEMEREMHAHLQLAEDEFRRRGLDPVSARRAARIAIGGFESVKEQHRRARGIGWLDDARRDLRQAARGVRRAPLATAVVMLVLALGIGANSAIFSLVDAVLFRPLPVLDADRLVKIGRTRPESADLDALPYALVGELAGRSSTLARVAGISDGHAINVTVSGGQAERVSGAAVTGEFFDVLGVRPAHGRLLGPDDDRLPGQHPVAVLSHAYWQARFRGDPGVLGLSVRINTTLFTVVGVSQESFRGITLEQLPDVWVPAAMLVAVDPAVASFKPFERREFSWLDGIARLEPGATHDRAAAELERLGLELAQVPSEREGRLVAVRLRDAMLAPARRQDASRLSWLLIGASGLLLILACAVVAGLLLARGDGRRREIALRTALGASQSRVLRQVFVETLFAAVSAAIAGVFIAQVAASALARLAAADFPVPFAAASSVLSSRVLWATLAFALFSTLIVGLIGTRRLGQAGLPDVARSSPTSIVGRPRLQGRHALVVAQVAIALILLVGAGLLIRSLAIATGAHLGFDPDRALLVSVDLSRSGYNRDRGQQFYSALLERVRALPGVRSAALSRHVPIQPVSGRTSIELTNVPAPSPGEERTVLYSTISPGFFAAMGIRLERGRDFVATDAGGPPLVIVNRAFAARFWPGRDPLGERVLNIGENGARVIGVSDDVKLRSIREDPSPMLYVPMSAMHASSMTLVVRTEVEPRLLAAGILAEGMALDPTVPMYRVRTLEEHLGSALGRERTVAVLLSAYAMLALVMAAAGLYAVVSYAARLRLREFGVRLALGAQPAQLVRLVVAQGALLAVAGVAVGLGISVAVSRVLSTLLFGISPVDPITLAATSAVLIVAAVGASLLPALRSARIDPTRALRTE